MLPLRMTGSVFRFRSHRWIAAGASAGVYSLSLSGLIGLTGAPLRGAESPSLFLVRAGQPAAIIVTEDHPSAVVSYAAQELAWHIEKATGAKLPVVAEHDAAADPAKGAANSGGAALTRIYLGDTQAAHAAGLDGAALAAENFVLKTGPAALYIAGHDTKSAPDRGRTGEEAFSDDFFNAPDKRAGDPLSMNTSAGTLFGVYELLERDLGVRWLWPGELGTYVPKTRDLAIPAVDEKIAPPFFQRAVRPGLTFKYDHPALGFTPGAAAAYARDQTVFLRRHRMGRGEVMTYHHAFVDWWDKYGAAHPEWFQQLAGGKRGPAKPGARFSMSVSSPGLRDQLVALWKAEPGPRSHYINAVENDILGLCTCDDCLAADGPEPAEYGKFTPPTSKMYGSRFVTDRYAKFWLAVQQLAAKDDPEVNVVGYAYENYFQPPTSGVKLNSHIIVGFCPSSYWYPRPPDEHEWVKRQWTGWSETGVRLFSRTNYFLDGYCMPFIFAHQFADDFQHDARHGMVATDFDSLTGHWSTQGPTLYLLMQLQLHPNTDPDALLDQYYAAFGPAAAKVKAYFDYWEHYTTDHRPVLMKSFADLNASRWRTFAKGAHAVFPPGCFPPAEALLQEAAQAAGSDRDAAARVVFLQHGLQHAELCARAAALLTLGDPSSTPARGKAALDELLAWRRAHEREWISNFSHDAWVEDLSWKLSDETKQQPELYP